MIFEGIYDEGYFVTIAPVLNYHVQNAVDAYRFHLREPDEGMVRFVNVTLEEVVEKIRRNDPSHAAALHRRYCDFWLVDGEMELNAPLFEPARKRPSIGINKPAEDSKARALRRGKSAGKAGHPSRSD